MRPEGAPRLVREAQNHFFTCVVHFTDSPCVMPDTYKKLVATQRSPDFRAAAEVVEEPIPEPGPHEVVVRNWYAGVNATDVNITAGRYAPGAEPPFDLGAEAAGEVVAVGRDVKHLQAGDAVVTSTLGGGYREYNCVRASNAYKVSEPTPEALSIMVSGLTASIALQEVADVEADDVVLVTAAAGGTGQYAVQLAKRNGHHVIGTCGTDEKVALLNDLGCDRPINYREEDVRAVLEREYPDGVDLVYEGVGGKLFDTCVDALAVHGQLLTIGYVSEYVDGPKPVTRPRIYTKLLGKSASIHGFFLPQFAMYFGEHLRHLMELLHREDLHVAIDGRTFQGIASIPDAVEHLHSGQSQGKVVVQLNGT